jgi:hypothetical protein
MLILPKLRPIDIQQFAPRKGSSTTAQTRREKRNQHPTFPARRGFRTLPYHYAQFQVGGLLSQKSVAGSRRTVNRERLTNNR